MRVVSREPSARHGESPAETVSQRVGRASCPPAHIPLTPAQLRKLCALLRERNLLDDRHRVCGVDSLKDLSRDQASECINRLLGGPTSGRSFHRGPDRRHVVGPRPSRTGAMRPASDRQRLTMAAVIHDLCELGESPESVAAVLWRDHLIRDPATTPMSTTTASKAIGALLAWLKNRRVAQANSLCPGGSVAQANSLCFPAEAAPF